MSNLVPEKMTYEQLADVLVDILARVKAGDSYEGNIEYSMPEEIEGVDANAVMVRGMYRIGNLEGQGGYRMIGSIPNG